MVMKVRSLNIVDYCTFAYKGVVISIVLLLHSRIPQWRLLILPNIIAIAVVLPLALAIGDRAALVPRLIRNLSPLGFFFPLYAQTGIINHIVFPGFLDPLFIRIEKTI